MFKELERAVAKWVSSRNWLARDDLQVEEVLDIGRCESTIQYERRSGTHKQQGVCEITLATLHVTSSGEKQLIWMWLQWKQLMALLPLGRRKVIGIPNTTTTSLRHCDLLRLSWIIVIELCNNSSELWTVSSFESAGE